jgi:thioredoxin-dependent peroxiredoxin
MKKLGPSFVVVLAGLGGCKDETTRNPPEIVLTSDALAEGHAAPDVTLTLHDGKTVKLAELRGEQVLVYFYPKDDTPGCTLEAKGLRDHYAALGSAGVKVFGVSLQDAESHKAFIDKYGLPFPLVVDDGTVARAFGVPVKGEYAARQSFLIGRDGKVARIWREVSPEGHAEEVLAAAR